MTQFSLFRVESWIVSMVQLNAWRPSGAEVSSKLFVAQSPQALKLSIFWTFTINEKGDQKNKHPEYHICTIYVKNERRNPLKKLL